MENTNELRHDLCQFTGTETWFKHLFGMLYTEGARYFAEKAGAYWFLDIVATELIQIQKRDAQPFLSVHLIAADGKADLKADDGNDNPLWERHIDFTDCPAGDWQFYLIDGVFLLPSEY